MHDPTRRACLSEEFRIIQKYLADAEKEGDISWFAYPLPTERSRKVAIRGLPITTTPGEIQKALENLGYVAEYVHPIKAKMGRLGCTFFTTLAATPNLLPGIYVITELLSLPRVVIEAWRRRLRPAQCHRCQAFRNSSLRCHRRMICVRCGGEHPARDCLRPKDSPAICVNCGGPHPANYTRCSYFKRELRLKNKKIPNAKSSQPGAIQPITNMVTADAQKTTVMAPAKPSSQGRRRRKRGGAYQASTQAMPRPPVSWPPATTGPHPRNTGPHPTASAHPCGKGNRHYQGHTIGLEGRSRPYTGNAKWRDGINTMTQHRLTLKDSLLECVGVKDENTLSQAPSPPAAGTHSHHL